MRRSLATLLPSWILLAALTVVNGSYWPFTWPDEALFSSPAADLVSHGTFTTPVLKGLIPGMERATLWNSPLFMLLLSAVYRITGESLLAGRSLSLVLGFAALFLFERILALFMEERRHRALLLVALALDLTFSRAAHTIRMDMLSLFFFFSVFWILYREFLRGPDAKGSYRNYFIAGIFTGLGALSHPVAVVLLPVWLLFVLPRVRPLAMGATGGILSFSTWLLYIVPHFEIFRLQFLSQLRRKGGMVRLWGGDTGGIFKVYASQYGGNRFVMAAVLLVMLLVILYGVAEIRRRMLESGTGGDGSTDDKDVPGKGWSAADSAHSIKKGIKIFRYLERDPYTRIYLSFLAVFAMVLLFSEGWYAVYVGPLALLVAAYPVASDSTRPAPASFRTRFIALLPLQALLLFFALSTLFFVVRNRVIDRTAERVAEFNAEVLSATSHCSSIYLRVRPDPYFLIRKAKPATEILEFIPGKLRFEGSDPSLRPERFRDSLEARYESLQCFLLDPHGSWEPILTEYLEGHRDRFHRILLEARSPLEPATLWVRK